MMLALHINLTDPIFIGDLCGFVLALPTTLFLSFWISSGSIKHPARGTLSALAGAFLGFLVILGWVGTLFSAKPLPYVSGTSTFFSSLLLCSILGVMACFFADFHRLYKHSLRLSYSGEHRREARDFDKYK